MIVGCDGGKDDGVAEGLGLELVSGFQRSSHRPLVDWVTCKSFNHDKTPAHLLGYSQKIGDKKRTGET
jgi:hypothetical protein